jgi:cytochrome P450
LEDFTLSGVFIPKGTTVGANMINAHFHPAMWGDNARDFDPYRFIRLEQDAGKLILLPTSTLHSLSFGYGRHACPGRFFAAQEIKLLMAYFLHYYDLELEGSNGARPKNSWVGNVSLPDMKAKVGIKRRREELG